MGIYAALFIPFIIAFATHKVVNGFVGIWIALISIASIACYFSKTATLFTVAFSLLGVICLIHSIIFLAKLKSYTKK